jgi:hypothetical protein
MDLSKIVTGIKSLKNLESDRILNEMRFSKDFKFILLDDTIYNTETGEEIGINEGWFDNWSFSDWAHTAADFVSAGADFIVPGSGAIVDALQCISYLVEAQFANESDKMMLYVMAVVSLAFAAMPGPLQAAAPEAKAAIKSGKVGTPVVKKLLGYIAGFLDTLLVKGPELLKRAINSSLGTKIAKKWKGAGKILGSLDSMIENLIVKVRPFLSKIAGTAGETAIGQVAKKGAAEVVETGVKSTAKKGGAKQVAKSATEETIKRALATISKRGVKGASPKLLTHLGFKKGFIYKMIPAGFTKSQKILIEEITSKGVVFTIKGGAGKTMAMPLGEFVMRTCAPYYGKVGLKKRALPLAIRFLTNFVKPDGTVDESIYDEDELKPSDYNMDEEGEPIIQTDYGDEEVMIATEEG